MTPHRRLRILTWHVHGNYLYYLTQVQHEFFLVADAARSTHHTGRSGTLPWGDNVHEIAAEDVAGTDFDVILYQSRDAWLVDRQTLLAESQRRLPQVYIEHDPPQEHPTETLHWVDEAHAVLVHVTAFNRLMWRSQAGQVRVIEHGVKPLNPARYTGRVASGIVVVNNLEQRGRRLGLDIYREVAAQVPLVLVGMASDRVGGEGEVPNEALAARVAEHRFFFNPIRYTSLGLAVIEAMMTGTPVVALATTELVTVIRDGENGLIDTRVDRLVDGMRRLLGDPSEAARLGDAGRRTAEARFHIDRFVDDWLALLRDVSA